MLSLLFALNLISPAAAAVPAPGPTPTPDTDPSLTIRVKIFPHLATSEPQGIDADPKHVTLKSAQECKVYQGTPGHTGSTGQLIQTTETIELSTKTLATALWIDCPAKVQVIRVEANENYYYLGPIYAHAVTVAHNGKDDPSNKVVELIHPISVENYLKGVVPVEMPPYWPNEALKSQAVAARTYAYFHLNFSREVGLHPYYDVDDTTYYQAFTGVSDETTATNNAVTSTNHQVVVYQGKIIQSYFSADSGGYTEDAANVWAVIAPYCKAKPEVYTDPGFTDGQFGPWTVTMSLAELNQALTDAFLIPNANPAVNLTIPDEDRFPSGRAKSIFLQLRDGASFELNALNFRRALALRSTLFSITIIGDQVRIDGRGFGHGVGMSQYGARVLAQMNQWTSSDILHFYYTDVQICDVSRGLTNCF